MHATKKSCFLVACNLSPQAHQYTGSSRSLLLLPSSTSLRRLHLITLIPPCIGERYYFEQAETSKGQLLVALILLVSRSVDDILEK